MRIRDVLDHKGREVLSIAPDETVLDAISLLVEHNVGSPVVMDGDEVMGMITERDALRLAARDTDGWPDTRVSAIMSEELVVAAESDDLDDAR